MCKINIWDSNAIQATRIERITSIKNIKSYKKAAPRKLFLIFDDSLVTPWDRWESAQNKEIHRHVYSRSLIPPCNKGHCCPSFLLHDVVVTGEFSDSLSQREKGKYLELLLNSSSSPSNRFLIDHNEHVFKKQQERWADFQSWSFYPNEFQLFQEDSAECASLYSPCQFSIWRFFNRGILSRWISRLD